MDGGAWWAAVHGVAEGRTRLSDFTFTFHFHPLDKEMATHSSILAWRIPGTAEPGGLPSMGSHRVGHNWSDLAAAATTREAGILPVLEYHLNSFWDVSWFYFCFLELIYFLIFPSFCSLFIQAEYIPSSPKKISLSFSFSAVFTAKKMKWSKCLILL